VLSLVVLPLWAFAASAVWLAIGAFLMQVMVQGAWGVIPVHLNELSPDDSRGTFPGFVYQLGNLIASFNATLQAGIAAHYGGNYALALAVVAGAVAVAIIILTAFGIEAKGVAFGTGRIRHDQGAAGVERAGASRRDGGPADPRTAASSDAF
jgi:MFS transporter, SHS family, lactate transporter